VPDAPPRLILVDLDGTLLGDDHQVSARNAAAIDRAISAGARVVVATGRPVRLLGPIRENLRRSVALCYNGAVVLDLATDRILDAHLLDASVFQRVVETVRASGLRFLVAVEGMPERGIRGEDGFRVGRDMQRGTLAEISDGGVVKGLVVAEADQFDRVWDAFALGFPGEIEVTRSGIESLIEISGPGVSKGGVIAGLAERWGIPAADAMAFGDMPNDLEMFRWAGRSVAMANAEPEVKLAATEVGADHNDDAVAQVLERWF
jgi:Cof subfamily protein (haloacid dehalogenase superfamily)